MQCLTIFGIDLCKYYIVLPSFYGVCALHREVCWKAVHRAVSGVPLYIPHVLELLMASDGHRGCSRDADGVISFLKMNLHH